MVGNSLHFAEDANDGIDGISCGIEGMIFLRGIVRRLRLKEVGAGGKKQ
jgi:hypothetical protein